jgi:hypothetical protein
MKQFADWCGRNIELIIWLNVVLLLFSAAEQTILGNWYPAGFCAVLVATILILRK